MRLVCICWYQNMNLDSLKIVLLARDLILIDISIDFLKSIFESNISVSQPIIYFLISYHSKKNPKLFKNVSSFLFISIRESSFDT